MDSRKARKSLGEIIQDINLFHNEILLIDDPVSVEQDTQNKFLESYEKIRESLNDNALDKQVVLVLKILVMTLIAPFYTTVIYSGTVKIVWAEGGKQKKFTAEYDRYLNSLLKTLNNNFPGEFIPYADYILLILRKHIILRLENSVELLKQEKINKAEISLNIKKILAAQTALEKMISCKNKSNNQGINNLVLLSAKTIFAFISYCTQFKNEKISMEMHNSIPTFMSLLDGKVAHNFYLAKRKYNFEKKNDTCLDYYIDFNQFYLSFHRFLTKEKKIPDSDTSKEIPDDILKAIKGYDFASLIKYLSSLNSSIVGDFKTTKSNEDLTGKIIYTLLFDMILGFFDQAKRYSAQVRDYDLNKQIECFVISFVQCEIIRQCFGEVKCKMLLNQYTNIKSDETAMIIELYSQICSESVILAKEKGIKAIALKNMFLKKIRAIENIVDNLPEDCVIVGNIYSSLAHYIGLGHDENMLTRYTFDAYTALKKLKQSNFPSEHKHLIWNFLTSILTNCSSIYQKYPLNNSENCLLKTLLLAKEVIYLHFYNEKNIDIDIYNIDIIRITASITFLSGFAHLEAKDKITKILDPFLDKEKFLQIWDHAINIVPDINPDNNNVQALLHWFKIYSFNCDLITTTSIKSFKDFDYNQLIDFLKSLDAGDSTNSLANTYINFSKQIDNRMNIISEVIFVTHRMLNIIAKTLSIEYSILTDSRSEIKSDESNPRTWIDYFKDKIKLLNFKIDYYSLAITKTRYPESGCDERIKEAVIELEKDKHTFQILQKYTSKIENNEIAPQITPNLDKSTKIKEQLSLLLEMKIENIQKFHEVFTKMLMGNNHKLTLKIMHEFEFIQHCYGFNKEQSTYMLANISAALENPDVKTNPLLIWAVILDPIIHRELPKFRPDEYHTIFKNLFKKYGVDDMEHNLRRVMLLAYYKSFHPENHFLQQGFYETDHDLSNILINHYKNLNDMQNIKRTYQYRMFAISNCKTVDNAEITLKKNKF